jgi:hypothetical protein
MFTLSDASTDTKEILKWAGIIIGALIILVILFNAFTYVKNLLYPTPPPKPTVAFGKLPGIIFPQRAIDAKLTYSVDTLSGNLPSFSDQIKVFRTQKAQPDLLALQKAKTKAASLGFVSEPTEISNSAYQWTNATDPSGLQQTLTMDITSYNFTLTSNFMQNPAVLRAEKLPDQFHAAEQAQTVLQDMGLLANDINIEKKQVNLFSIKNDGLIPASSFSNTQIIEVNFPQKDINNFPVYFEQPNITNINFLIAGGSEQTQAVQINYLNQTASDQFATYPLKTAELAFSELKQNKAYIAAYYGTDKVLIKNVFLAYYISNKEQDLIMPIIVFEGNNGFFAYVSAITDEWISK